MDKKYILIGIIIIILTAVVSSTMYREYKLNAYSKNIMQLASNDSNNQTTSKYRNITSIRAKFPQLNYSNVDDRVMTLFKETCKDLPSCSCRDWIDDFGKKALLRDNATCKYSGINIKIMFVNMASEYPFLIYNTSKNYTLEKINLDMFCKSISSGSCDSLDENKTVFGKTYCKALSGKDCDRLFQKEGDLDQYQAQLRDSCIIANKSVNFKKNLMKAICN